MLAMRVSGYLRHRTICAPAHTTARFPPMRIAALSVGLPEKGLLFTE